MSATVDLIQKIYIGYFGRAGDPAGLEYWVGRKAAGMSDTAVAQSFSVQPEATAMYGFLAAPSLGLGQDAFLEAVYQNLFERSVETDGATYWKGQLSAGRSVGGIILDIINGAQGADATAVANKLAVANHYTQAVLNANATWTLADDQADAIAVLANVTSVTSTVDTAKALATSLVAADIVPAGSTFTLTTGVDAVSGSAGNDTISGLIGASGTYTVGDNISGGSGTDTANLIDAGSATSAPFVSMSGVEIVNVRMLSAGTTIINANSWEGVATLTNASSTDGSTLNATGVSTTTTVKVFDDSDVNIAFSNTTTAASVSLTLVSVGTGNTATTIGSASAAATANIDLDLNNSGLIDAVVINVQGTVNLARIEAGSNVDTYTITGSGNASLVTDDTITSFDASAAQGSIDITFQSASEVTAKGGAGNDTFNFGTTLSNSDSVDGGAGTDTITATIGGFNRNLRTTAVETATITFNDDNGGAVDASGSTVSTLNLRGGSAGADAIVNQIANGATVNLTVDADAFGSAQLDGVSGAQSISIVAGTASGSVAFDLTVTDIANVTLSNVAGTATNAGTLTIATASFDEDTKSISVNAVTGTGAIAFTDLLVGGATAVTITSNASGGITLGTGISGSALGSVSLVANGSADIVGETIEGSGLASITLDANGGGNIFLADTGSGIELGNNGTGSTQRTVVLTLNAETNSDIGTAASNASGVLINTTGSIGLSINFGVGSASGGVHLGIVTVALGGASAETSGTFVNVSAGSIATNSIVRTEKINIDGMSGTQVNIGAASVGASATYVLASGGIDAENIENVDVSAATLTLAASAIVQVGAITTTAGAVNGIAIVASDGATAIFGAIVASAVGAISVSLASGAEADFGNIVVSGSAAGSIVGAVGAIELGGSDGADVTFGTIGASAVGAVAISGALDVTFGTITSNRIGVIDARNQGVSGALTIDLSGVSAAAEVYAGLAASNIIISGKGNDVIDLIGGRTAATGNDVIRYTNSAQGTDNIIDFIAGGANSGGDQIEIVGSGGIVIIGGSGEISTADRAVDLLFMSADAAAGSANMVATDNVIIFQSAYATTALFLAAIASGGAREIAFAGGTAAAAAGNLVVVWTNGSEAQVATVSIAAGASAVSADSVVNVLATLQGVTPGALVAANFDFV